MIVGVTLVLAVLALAGDVWSTEKAMATGLTHEANRFMAYLMGRLGRTAALLITHTGAALVLFFLESWLANLVIAAVFGWATWHNLNLKALRK